MPRSNDGELKHVGECLYRSHTGVYYALVKVSGKQIKRSLKTSNEGLAKQRLRIFREKANRLTGTEQKLAFEGLAKQWLESIKSHLKEKSYERRVTCIKQVMPFFQGHLVRSIGQKEIELWKSHRSQKLSARSFNIEIETLRLVFEYAKEDLRIILENPAARLKRKKELKKSPSIPTKNEFLKLIQAMREEPKSEEAADFIEFLAYSGLRLGEAGEVCWKDVNFMDEKLTVTGGKRGTKNSEYRVIPLFPPLKDLLLQIKSKKEQIAPSSQEVFSIKSSKKAIAGACKRANLPHWGHHVMRHFFCSNAIEAGIDFKVIAEWLGHKDGGILVAKTYGHLRNEHSYAMAQKMTFKAVYE